MDRVMSSKGLPSITDFLNGETGNIHTERDFYLQTKEIHRKVSGLLQNNSNITSHLEKLANNLLTDEFKRGKMLPLVSKYVNPLYPFSAEDSGLMGDENLSEENKLDVLEERLNQSFTNPRQFEHEVLDTSRNKSLLPNGDNRSPEIPVGSMTPETNCRARSRSRSRSHSRSKSPSPPPNEDFMASPVSSHKFNRHSEDDEETRKRLKKKRKKEKKEKKKREKLEKSTKNIRITTPTDDEDTSEESQDPSEQNDSFLDFEKRINKFLDIDSDSKSKSSPSKSRSELGTTQSSVSVDGNDFQRRFSQKMSLAGKQEEEKEKRPKKEVSESKGQEKDRKKPPIKEQQQFIKLEELQPTRVVNQNLFQNLASDHSDNAMSDISEISQTSDIYATGLPSSDSDILVDEIMDQSLENENFGKRRFDQVSSQEPGEIQTSEEGS